MMIESEKKTRFFPLTLQYSRFIIDGYFPIEDRTVRRWSVNCSNHMGSTTCGVSKVNNGSMIKPTFPSNAALLIASHMIRKSWRLFPTSGDVFRQPQSYVQIRFGLNVLQSDWYSEETATGNDFFPNRSAPRNPNLAKEILHGKRRHNAKKGGATFTIRNKNFNKP